MTTYRLRRRAFIASVGGAFGLKLLLRNLEASAAGSGSPPRFLMTHFPGGTVRQQFVPTGTGSTYVTSPILKPFEDAGLRSDMIALIGLNHSGLTCPGGGGSEAGTPFATTGAASPGTRANGGETDDSVAGGPSWDQIFLKHVAGLAQRSEAGSIIGPGYVNAICDRRIDSNEASTQCLSYSHETRPVASANPGGTITEHVPLMPEPSPARLYAKLFSGFMPDGDVDAALKALRLRKSVLDSALRDLARLRELAPVSEREKLDAHAAHVRALEMELSRRIAEGGVGPACTLPEAPPESLVGKSGNARYLETQEADNEMHEAVGRAHLAIIRAGFQCDLIRVASFQWAPGTGHVALSGLDPSTPETAYAYRTVSRRVFSSAFWTGPRPTDNNQATYDIVTNSHIWYSQRMAAALADFKSATDVFGGRLLDHTIVPYVTEIGDPSSNRTFLPALVFGGRALGMVGGQFLAFSPTRHHNDLWATLAQAYFGTSDPLATPELQGEGFYKTSVSPLVGLWRPPA